MVGTIIFIYVECCPRSIEVIYTNVVILNVYINIYFGCIKIVILNWLSLHV